MHRFKEFIEHDFFIAQGEQWAMALHLLEEQRRLLGGNVLRIRLNPSGLW